MDHTIVLREGRADLVYFYATGTYIEDALVKVFPGGIVHVLTPAEDVTLHISTCEIVWFLRKDDDNDYNGTTSSKGKQAKVRFLSSVKKPSSTPPPTGDDDGNNGAA